MDRVWGANPEKNQWLAQRTGYTGDFGSGGFGAWAPANNWDVAALNAAFNSRDGLMSQQVAAPEEPQMTYLSDNPYIDAASGEIIFPPGTELPQVAPSPAPTPYTQGYEIGQFSFTAPLLRAINNKDLLWSKIGQDTGGNNIDGDSGVYEFDPKNPFTTMKKIADYYDPQSPGMVRSGGQGVSFMPGYYAGDPAPMVNAADIGYYQDYRGDVQQGRWNDLTGRPATGDSFLTDYVNKQRYAQQGGINAISRQWMPGLTAAVIAAISGGAGSALLAPALGATAGGAIGGGVAGGLMALPKTLQGDGLGPLATGIAGGALSGISGANLFAPGPGDALGGGLDPELGKLAGAEHGYNSLGEGVGTIANTIDPSTGLAYLSGGEAVNAPLPLDEFATPDPYGGYGSAANQNAYNNIGSNYQFQPATEFTAGGTPAAQPEYTGLLNPTATAPALLNQQAYTSPGFISGVDPNVAAYASPGFMGQTQFSNVPEFTVDQTLNPASEMYKDTIKTPEPTGSSKITEMAVKRLLGLMGGTKQVQPYAWKSGDYTTALNPFVPLNNYKGMMASSSGSSLGDTPFGDTPDASLTGYSLNQNKPYDINKILSKKGTLGFQNYA
jgi:hypothetical protein